MCREIREGSVEEVAFWLGLESRDQETFPVDREQRSTGLGASSRPAWLDSRLWAGAKAVNGGKPGRARL